MWPYWLLFLVSMTQAISHIRPRFQPAPVGRWPTKWWWVFGLLVLMIGLRFEVGADFHQYLYHLENSAKQTFNVAILAGDPGYSLLTWFFTHSNLEFFWVNLVCAGLFSWGLVEFCRAQPRPWLAMTVAVPYLVVVVAMGYMRQSAAIGLALLGLVALGQGRVLRYLLWLAIAATFHKSAVIIMPLAALAGARHKYMTMFWVLLITFLMFVLLLQEHVESLTTNYLQAGYSSSGAMIRVTMNALPALLFLLLRNRFHLPRKQNKFWTWMSLGALLFVVLLAISPSSTAVDRVALYWIPLQLFVISRLPNALGQARGSNSFWVTVVIGYSAAVMFVWLNFAVHAQYWLPYQFYPWVWLWQ